MYESHLIAMTNAAVQFLAWFLVPFAVFIVVEWVTGLFRNDY